jgi:uncharacterized protein (UPF0335 family)
MQARGGDGRDIDPDDNNHSIEVNSDQLHSIVDRIERLESERRELLGDIKEIKQEAKDAGYLIPVINLIIRERRKDREKLDEFLTSADAYRRALEDY